MGTHLHLHQCPSDGLQLCCKLRRIAASEQALSEPSNEQDVAWPTC